MNTDPIADLLTRIRNASKAHHQKVSIPHSNVKENILKIMKKYKFIEDYSVGNEGGIKVLVIELSGSATVNLKRISKPGQRIYVKHSELKTIKSGLGIRILSTPKGVMCNTDAYKQKLGGEVLCEIY